MFDIRKMMSEARLPCKVNEASPSFVYNILNDCQPLAIIDARPAAEYSFSRVRKSIPYIPDLAPTEDRILFVDNPEAAEQS
jgi:hypothetical protein